jgi:hypothetical protein
VPKGSGLFRDRKLNLLLTARAKHEQTARQQCDSSRTCRSIDLRSGKTGECRTAQAQNQQAEPNRARHGYFRLRRLRSINMPPDSKAKAAVPAEASISGTAPANKEPVRLKNTVVKPKIFIIIPPEIRSYFLRRLRSINMPPDNRAKAAVPVEASISGVKLPANKEPVTLRKTMVKLRTFIKLSS